MPAECFDPRRNACVLSGGCRLRGILGEAVEAFYGTLARYSVADLQIRPRQRRALFAAAA